MHNPEFSQALLAWFDQWGRKHLPWQQRRTAYRVWVSEIMLQQTQVATVIPYFERFMDRFPTIYELAMASQDEVLHLWTGLGYYARGRNLHRCAQAVVAKYEGEFPDDVAALSQLPGIGKSTAGAIISIAYNKRAVILDGNVKRVLARFHAISGWPGKTSVANTLWRHAERHTPHRRCDAYSQAIMDLGATLCTRSQPQCQICPLQSHCTAFRRGDPQSFPGKKPKKTLPVKKNQLLMIIHRDDNTVWLQRRPPQGIWGGLWSFPELAPDSDPVSCVEHRFGKVISVDNWPVFRHTFTHYHWDIQPVFIVVGAVHDVLHEDRERQWFAHAQIAALGLSAPIKRLLTKLSMKAK